MLSLMVRRLCVCVRWAVVFGPEKAESRLSTCLPAGINSIWVELTTSSFGDVVDDDQCEFAQILCQFKSTTSTNKDDNC